MQGIQTWYEYSLSNISVPYSVVSLPMVLLLDGISEHWAHIWSKSGI